MEMSVKQQFQAAVRVIQNLPKDGKFQASDSLKLKLYGFYKQATEGRNETRKPAFYDVVNRYKWDAWARLGDMSQEAAMKAYVDELKGIIETMGLSSDVSLFYETIGPMYEFVDIEPSDVSMKNEGEHVPSFKGDLAPSVINSDTFSTLSNDHIPNGHVPVTHPVNGSILNGPPKSASVTSLTVDSDGDEFSDTVDTLNEPAIEVPIIRGDETCISKSGFDRSIGGPTYTTISREVDDELSRTLLKLRTNISALTGRMDSLERILLRREHAASSILPLAGLSSSTVAFIVGWPIIVQAVIYLIRQRQVNRSS